MFSQQQKQIIKLLQNEPNISLSKLSGRIKTGKSSLFYQLNILCELGIVQRLEKSPKKINYSLSDNTVLNRFIQRQTFELENILTSTKIEGTDQYISLLKLVSEGKGNIIGYSNLEKKLLPSLKKHIFEYRNNISQSNRIDRFIVPSSEQNIALVNEHFANNQWSDHFKAKFISKDLINLNSDMYVWDNKVGICSFDGEKLNVVIHNDKDTHDLFRNFLETLWGIALDKEIYFGSRTSELTAVEKSIYLDSKNILNLADGYPRGINPQWVIDYQTKISNPEFIRKNPKDYISIIEEYFSTLLNSKSITLTPTATYSFVIACDVVLETPGDEFIVLDPGFDSYPNIIRSFGGNVVYAKRNRMNSLDINQITNKCTPRTKAIVLCIPENPQGTIYSSEEISRIAKLCVSRSITLIIDYCFIEISPYKKSVPLLTSLKNINNLSYILIGDTGKILGLNGSKFGCLGYSENFTEKIENKVNVYFFQLSQYDLYLISSIIKDRRFATYLKKLNDLVLENYEYLNENLNKRIKVFKPHGSSVCLLDIKNLKINDLEFANILKHKYKLGVVPASYFYGGEEVKNNYLIRLALARPIEDIEECTEIINEMIENIIY